MSSTVDIDPALLETIQKSLRLGKRSEGKVALTVKIDKTKHLLLKDEYFESISLDDLVEELPENSPRFVILSYQLSHPDGRVSFPLLLLNYIPETSSTELRTLYASSLPYLVQKSGIYKVMDVREGELTKETLDAWLLR